jgi:hypothetical protein
MTVRVRHTLFSSSDHSCCAIVAAYVSMAYFDLTVDDAVPVIQGDNAKHGPFGS